MGEHSEERYLTVEEAASYTRLSLKTVYRWAEAGLMPAHKIGRIWRFDRLELDEFMHRGLSERLIYSSTVQ